jgi:1,4-dihydroxy-2-naphthoate polyprenyltransferase
VSFPCSAPGAGGNAKAIGCGGYGLDVEGSDPGIGSSIAERRPRLWALWAAARPSQVALVLVVYLLGVGLATTGPSMVVAEPTADTSAAASRRLLASALSGAIALVPVAVTIHYANEYADSETDALTDRTPFSGGSGALVRTGLPASFLRSATVAALATTAVVMAAVVLTGVPVGAVVLLLTILGLGLAYSLPPPALVRRGVGEAVNATLGGIALPLYGVAVVATPRATAVLAVVPFSLVVGCSLLATHWPDREADAATGKRTLAVRWSPARIRRAYATLAVAAAVATAGAWIGGAFPDVVALAHLASAPFLVRGGVVLTRRRSPLPAVLAMVTLALATAVAWWWVGVGAGV